MNRIKLRFITAIIHFIIVRLTFAFSQNDNRCNINVIEMIPEYIEIMNGPVFLFA